MNDKDLLNAYHSASPEKQEAVRQILELKECTPKAIKEILINCGVSSESISVIEKELIKSQEHQVDIYKNLSPEQKEKAMWLDKEYEEQMKHELDWL